MRSPRLLGFGLAVASCAGCATVPPEAGFPDVERVVAERTGLSIRWNRGGADDEDMARNVRALLDKELTVDQAVQLALFNNRRLQALYEDLGIAQADVVQAGLLTNPTLYNEIRFGSGTALPFENDVAKDFVDILLLPAKKGLANVQFEQVKLRVTDSVLGHVSDVKAAFYSLQGAMQLLEMRQTVASSTEAAADAARRLRKAGNITELERDKNQAQHEQSLFDLEQAEEDVLAAREKLAGLLGLWGADVGFRVPGRLPTLPAKELPATGLESIAIAHRSDLAVAQRDVEVASRELGITGITRWLPMIQAGAHNEHEPEKGVDTAGPSLEVVIPIFDQGQAKVARGEAELRRARERHAALAVDIRSQVRAARLRMSAARRRAERSFKSLLPIRERIVQETLLHYNAMQLGVFHLLSAKQEQIDAGRQYIESLRDYWIARSELERVLGGKLPVDGEPGSPIPPPTGAPAAPSPPVAPGHEHNAHHEHGKDK